MKHAPHGVEGSGLRHLNALAKHPRGAGSDEESEARRYSSNVLARAGYRVVQEPFTYSAFPGRFAMPIAGAMIVATLAGGAILGLRDESVVAPAAVLAIGLLLAGLFARAMLGDGVLDVSLMRRAGTNLMATRHAALPKVWLVAHLDTKSQPIPSAVRVTGVALLLISIVLAILTPLLTLAGAPARMVWWAVLAAAIVGGVPVMFSLVANKSDGAVDNASGAAAVLSAAERIAPDASVGVLLTSAEELGLAGARAWTRDRQAGIALNCDGVDDDGSLLAMYNGACPQAIVQSLQSVSRGGVRAKKMPIGLLTDSTALAARGWNAVTVSHGSLKTLRRVHTASDSLNNLRGDRIDEVAELLARSAEVLAR